MKKKFRKAHPQPPRYYWWDSDNCWCCKHRNNCGNCSILKKYMAGNIRKDRHKTKQALKEQCS